MKLIVGGPIQKNTGIMISVNVSVPIEHRSCKKKKILECDKDCETGVYLK